MRVNGKDRVVIIMLAYAQLYVTISLGHHEEQKTTPPEDDHVEQKTTPQKEQYPNRASIS